LQEREKKTLAIAASLRKKPSSGTKDTITSMQPHGKCSKEWVEVWRRGVTYKKPVNYESKEE